MKRRDFAGAAVLLGSLLGVGVAQAAADEPVVVRMIQFDRQGEADWQKAVIAQFEKEQSHIKVELISAGDSTERDKALAMLAAGDPPEITSGDPYTTISWGLKGYALDLEPFFQKDGGQDPFKDFYPAVLDMHVVDGHRYAIPEDLQVQGFLYVKKPFDDAGLAYPDDSWTWSKVEQVSPKLTVDANGDGLPERWAMRDPQYLHWWPILWSFGGHFVDDLKTPARFTGDTAGMREGLSWFNRMITNHLMPPYGSSKGSTGQNLVVGQTVAMAIGNSLYEQEMIPYADKVPWDVSRLPKGPTGTNVAFDNAIGWMIVKGSKHPKEAWEVIKYFSSRTAMQLAVQMRGTLVPYLPVTRDDWMNRYPVPEHRQAFIDAIPTAQPLPIVYDDGLKSIRDNTKNYWNGKISLPQALENMNTQVTAWIKSVNPNAK
ncbi:MAG TPA: sugar ABC transporter substrate-binding protein [Limnochordia bacterium]|nr:sugar ABC transporter substrate-binding protein [Limnochordia bacterium]